MGEFIYSKPKPKVEKHVESPKQDRKHHEVLHSEDDVNVEYVSDKRNAKPVIGVVTDSKAPYPASPMPAVPK